MQRKSFADVECNIARSVEEVGDGWCCPEDQQPKR